MKYLLIGNSAASIGAAEAIRRVDSKGSIRIVGDEPHPVYSRPLLTHYLAGQVEEEALPYGPAELYRKLKIVPVLGVRAVSLHVGRKRVTLSDGRGLHYDRLLIASGSSGSVPPISGIELPGVCQFRTLEDARRLKELAREAKEAVVIGAGLVGFSGAIGLHEAGVKVTLVEMAGRILPQILDEGGARVATSIFTEHGMRVVTGRRVREIVGSWEGVESVVLEDGERIPAQIVLLATGIKPELDLVAGTPIQVSAGILVDSALQTSVPGVFAAGDVAEPLDITLERSGVVPNWPAAHEQGRIAGSNMAGSPKEYKGGMRMATLELFGTPCVSLGLVEGDGCRELVREHPLSKIYKRLLMRDGVIVGAVFIEEIERAGLVASLMRNKVDLSDVEEEVLREGGNFIAFLRERRRAKMEGAVSWPKVIGMEQKFKKRFDEKSWEIKEKGEAR